MKILCETSMRHIHLTESAVASLFGKGAKLTEERPLSQPGQFLCKERVTIIGAKNKYENVAIIGPVRKENQTEISRTDSFFLGIKNVPIRLSGELKDAPTITIKVNDKEVPSAVIIAKRHIHLDPKTAKENGFKHGEARTIKFEGERGAMLCECVVRVDINSAPAVHIDSDESNAVLSGNTAEII
jgi:putative phosphotransacetylase